MAEILKRRHDLVAFKVALDAAGAEPRVRCALEVTEGHVLRTEAEWECVPAELGLPARVERGQARGAIPLRLPPRLLDELRQRVLGAGEPAALWLHLVKPYAHLGIAPWDRVLTEALGLPVLRLPDFLVPPARESPRTLDVALCVSQPRATSTFDAPRFVASIVGDVAAGVPRARVTVHLFTDAGVYGEIRAAAGGDNPVRLPAAWSTSGEVVLWLHDPRDAASYARPRAGAEGGDVPGRIDNPWLLWMRDTLRGRCLDVVHFACHGYYALDRGAVALAASPVHDDDEGMARFVGAAELDTFLTQTGAWAAAFSSPPGNFSDAGLRHLADDLAQRKPFATLYHDLAHDEDCRDLALAYRFLYDPQPAQPRPMACASIYCQPCRITGDVPEVPGEQPTAPANDAGPGTAGGYEKSAGEGGSYGGGGGWSYGGGGQEFGVAGGASYGGGGVGSSGGGGSLGGGGSGSRDGGGSFGGGGSGSGGGGGSYGGGGSGSSGGGSYDGGVGSSGGGSYGGGGVGSSGGGGFGGGGSAGSFDAGLGSDGGMDGGYRRELESAGASDGGSAEEPYPEASEAPAAPPAWPADEPEAAGPPSAPSPAPAPASAEAALAEVFRTADAVPTWLAAAQRFVEGHAWQVRQWEQGATPAAPEQQAELEVTRQTLAQIQEVLARHAVAAQAARGEP